MLGGGPDTNSFAGQAFGSAIHPNIIKQMQARSTVKAKRNKSDEEISFLNSKTAWVKLSSGVDINGSPDLAKKNILFGGTLFQEESAFKLRQGFDLSDPDKSAYTNNPTDKGIVPLPGIIDFRHSIKGGGGVGATTTTDITFKVYDLTQYILFEELYLKIGSTMLLEFGNSSYVDNRGNIKMDVQTVSNFFDGDVAQSAVLDQINTITENADYNYRGQIVSLFNYQVNIEKDGTYTLKCQLMGKGVILEAFKATGNPIVQLQTPGATEKYQQFVANAFLFKEDGDDTPTSEAIAAESDKFTKSLEASATSPLTDVLDDIYKIGNDTEEQKNFSISKNKLGFDPKKDLGVFLSKVDNGTPDKDLIYIRFSTWMKLINSTLIPTGNADEKVIKFASDGVNSAYVTYRNHFALDPSISILPKLPVDENLYTAWRKKDIFATGKGDNIYNIWLNVKMLSDTLKEMLKGDSTYTIGLSSYIDEILSKISVNMGGYSDLTLSYIEKLNTYVVIDDKIHTAHNINQAEIQLMGLESNIEDIKMSTKVSSALGTMAAIQSLDTTNKTSIEGQLHSSLGTVSDRMKKVIKDTTGDPIGNLEELQKGNQETYEAAYVKYAGKHVEPYREIINKFVGDLQIDPDDMDVLIGTNIAFQKNEFVRCYGNYNFGKLPFELELTMDGIAGMSINEKFKISPGVLPDYLTDRSTYTIVGLDHSIKENRWTTTIKCAPGISNGPQGERFKETTFSDMTAVLNPEVAEKINPATENKAETDK